MAYEAASKDTAHTAEQYRGAGVSSPTAHNTPLFHTYSTQKDEETLKFHKNICERDKTQMIISRKTWDGYRLPWMPKETRVLCVMRWCTVTGELAPRWPSYAHSALSDTRSHWYDYGTKYKYLLGMFFFLLENDAFSWYLPQILSNIINFLSPSCKKLSAY